MITSLRESHRGPRLRAPEALAARGLACPFYAVRWAIAMAVDAATVAAQDDPAEMARRWRLREQAVEQVAAGTAILAQSLTTKPPATRWPLLEPRDVTQTDEALFHLHRSGRLTRAADHARKLRQLFSNNQGNVWRIVFVADLGFTWKALTGSNPTRTDPFVSFIAAAFESCSDNPPALSWEWTVRKALTLGLDWGRYEKYFAQPKTKTQALDGP